LSFHLSAPRLTPWQRSVVIGVVVAVSSQLYFSVLTDGFRISASAILYPILLVTMMRDSHRPFTGLMAGLCVLIFRTGLDLAQGGLLLPALFREYPGGIFYLCYDALLCLLVRDRRAVSPARLFLSFWLCDFLSNWVNFVLAGGLTEPNYSISLTAFWGITLALGRSLAACFFLWAMVRYRSLLLREEHEARYRHLFLMTADLKTELYFLKKDAEDIEAVMSHAYQLYERLEKDGFGGDLSALALSIARDVHEVKKDNLRIIRGIEEEVAGAYDHQAMVLGDLLHILELTTRQFLGSQRADIRLECRYRENLLIGEHYQLLSILKNLVTNAVEAIQSGSGRGLVQVDCHTQGEHLIISVSDNGPGIPQKAMDLLFQVGYSTKFDPSTGNINRGVGLPAVQYLIDELGGTIHVQSQPNQETCFRVSLPLHAVTGGAHANLHH
jgi:two-component system sensor histidine kinase YcbA